MSAATKPKRPNPNQGATPKKVKEKIDKRLKEDLWIKYCGAKMQTSACLCCQKHEITIWNFHCGHVVAESKGGKTDIENLRPVCAACNQSMHTTDMVEFMKTHNYPKSNHWNGYTRPWIELLGCV